MINILFSAKLAKLNHKLQKNLLNDILGARIYGFGLLILILILICLGVISCSLTITRPKLEMSLAQSAFLAAKESGADELAPSLFRKAEIYYLKAKSAYRRKYFDKAKAYAELSTKFSEQSEFSAIKSKVMQKNE